MLRAGFEAIRRGISKTRAAVTGGLRGVLKGRDLDEELIDRIESTLVASDMGVRVAREVVDEVRRAFRAGTAKRGGDAVGILKDRLKERLRSNDLSLAKTSTGPTVIVVVGVNGSGKTTSVAKIAKALKDEGRSVLLAAGDTYRAGAVAQLEAWAKRLGIDMVRGSNNADPASVMFDACDAAIARKADVLLVDTAGRLHNQEGLMRQLVKIRGVLAKKIAGAPHETLLVLDATTGQSSIAQAKAFGQASGVTGVFLSKLDGTARGGFVVQIREELGVPVKLVGLGETPEDVEPFDADRFVEAMFESLDDLKE